MGFEPTTLRVLDRMLWKITTNTPSHGTDFDFAL